MERWPKGSKHAHFSQLYPHLPGSSHLTSHLGPSKFISSLSPPPSQNPNSTRHPGIFQTYTLPHSPPCKVFPRPPADPRPDLHTPQDLQQSGPCLPKVCSDHSLPHYTAGQWHGPCNSGDGTQDLMHIRQELINELQPLASFCFRLQAKGSSCFQTWAQAVQACVSF